MVKENRLRIQDDLYHFVNDDTLRHTVIPTDEPTAGGYSDLDKGVEALLMADFAAMASGEKPIPEEHLRPAVSLYKKARDLSRRNQEGIAPLQSDLAAVLALASPLSLNAVLSDWILFDRPLPFSLEVETDLKDSSRHSLVLSGPDTILPDPSYYEEGNEQGKKFLAIFAAMARQLLALTDLRKEEQEETLTDALLFDRAIACRVKSAEDWADERKNYHPWQSGALFQALKPLDLASFLLSFYGRLPEKIIVYDPRFLKSFSTLFNEGSFTQFKHWAYLWTLLDGTSYCDENTRHLGNTYRRALEGIETDSSIEKQAFHIADDAFAEPVGLYYGKTYFGEEAKRDVIALTKEIIAMDKKRIKSRSFLSRKTKAKAILKLDSMAIKMGYPEKIEALYDQLSVAEDASLYEALSTLEKQKNTYAFSELFTPVDHQRWTMAGDEVNACYESSSNDISFPAAILQAPFYSLQQSRSANLGGIGTVIGHEISHAFDNNGALYDEKGNWTNWWGKSDRKKFKALTAKMVKQFDGLPLAGAKVNGKLTVSENIADNGGMAVTLAIMAGMPRPSYEDYFTAYAKSWCEKARDEYLQLLMAVDFHAPAELRANIPPRNFKEWYRTYHVKKSDRMYLAKAKRLVIW